MTAPIGYFVHHQGRGHAERAAAIVNALPAARPVVLFSARDDFFPALAPHVSVRTIPSLFERPADAIAALDGWRMPSTLHCAPLGWPSITRAVATIARWFDEARPALFVTDVSAELAQLARIASVPCVAVLQHGARDDIGHMAAYEGAVGVLAPYHARLEQPGRPDWMLAKTHHAPGVGIVVPPITRAAARAALDLPPDAEIVLVVAGGGGSGTPAAPITLGARAEPDSLWLTIGEVRHEWHETAPGNLRHLGWVADPATHIAAADRIVSSAGNTTVHMIAAIGRPWIVVPEWRYFDEQLWKARMLAQAGAAVTLDHWPAHGAAWRAAWDRAGAIDVAVQRALVDRDAAAGAAGWLERLAVECSPVSAVSDVLIVGAGSVTLSVCTLGAGRADHLVNLVHGLNRQRMAPVELVIGVMQDDAYALPSTAFPVRQVMLSGATMPLAAARNAAARAASADRIAFLDIDCIPDPAFVGDYAERLGERDAVGMGEVSYLPAGATDGGIDYPRFESLAEQHSERAGPPIEPLGACSDYRCFWSLNFAMRRDRFLALGGFDEGYVGYGGEDTDFGRTFFEAGVPLLWVRGARAYHQYHPHHMPPVHHVDSVIANARRFRDKWGHWTMEHWLRAFVLMGLIARRGDDYVRLRDPDERDFALTRQQTHQPYASSSRVLAMLEADAPAIAAA